MKRAKKRASARLGEGAKAPKLSDRMDSLEKKIEEGFISLKINRDFDKGLGASSAGRASIDTSAKMTIASPPAPPPYRSRLENIFCGLCELENMQRVHSHYLAGGSPTPPNGPGNVVASPQGLDELFSAIESELNINQLMFRDLSNKF